MQRSQRQNGILLLAVIAIAAALLCLLALHSSSGQGADFAAILPLLFVAVISPLSLLPRMTYVYASRVPAAPALPVWFQRPPPSLRG
jgi:heme/copper-type cytochrome/quinol oxidase subunit 4